MVKSWATAKQIWSSKARTVVNPTRVIQKDVMLNLFICKISQNISDSKIILLFCHVQAL